MKLQFIDDCKLWWKMNTIRFWLAVGIIPEVMAALSDDVKDNLPGPMRGGLSAIALISIFLRLQKQPALEKKE